MPIYEYQCHHCNHQFEALQKVSDAPLSNCPECNHVDVKKLVSATTFRLKGDGWYETDFKSKPSDKTASKTIPSVAPKEPKTQVEKVSDK